MNLDTSSNSHPVVRDNSKSTNYNSNVNNNCSNNSNLPKPALPPKPAPPVKVTPPPPPRQSTFHTQFIAKSENKVSDSRNSFDTGHENTDINSNRELESRLAGIDFKDKPEKKNYSRDTNDLSRDQVDSNVKSSRSVSVNAR